LELFSGRSTSLLTMLKAMIASDHDCKTALFPRPVGAAAVET